MVLLRVVFCIGLLTLSVRARPVVLDVIDTFDVAGDVSQLKSVETIETVHATSLDANSEKIPGANNITILEAVNATNPEAINADIPEAVNSTIPEAVNATVPGAVNATIPGAINTTESVAFGYEGSNGPNLWPGGCQITGPGQSPIDIRKGSADFNAIKLAVNLQKQTDVKVINTGHGLDFKLAEGAAASTFVPLGEKDNFTMAGFHVHSPSEHHIDGKYFDVELHMVMKSASGGIAVISTLYEVSKEPLENNIMSVIAGVLPTNGSQKTLPVVDFASVIAGANDFTGFHTYNGSLTTPPCSLGVRWHVMDTPIPISVDEAMAFRAEEGFTARLIQVARDEQSIFSGTFVVGEPTADEGKEPADEKDVGDATEATATELNVGPTITHEPSETASPSVTGTIEISAPTTEAAIEETAAASETTSSSATATLGTPASTTEAAIEETTAAAHETIVAAHELVDLKESADPSCPDSA